MKQVFELLHRCTVRLSACGERTQGTGFFVAPGQILTCAHVVAEQSNTIVSPTPCTEPIIVFWNGEIFKATVKAFLPNPYPDLAMLEIAETHHPCVLLNGLVQPYDHLYGWGYIGIAGITRAESVTPICEGFRRDEASETNREFLKFKATQILPGLSGAPLLNLKTGGVCGIIKQTRDLQGDYGGYAVPAGVILDEFPGLFETQCLYHSQYQEWMQAARNDGLPIFQVEGEGKQASKDVEVLAERLLQTLTIQLTKNDKAVLAIPTGCAMSCTCVMKKFL